MAENKLPAMRFRGSFVQRLINFFEGIRSCESTIVTDQTTNNEIKETAESDSNEPQTPTITTESALGDLTEPQMSNYLLHSSVFLIPTLQMLFEIIGFRPRRQSLLDIAEFCDHLLNLTEIMKRFRDQTASPVLGRLPSRADDLARLNHLRDVLDNVDLRPRKLRAGSQEGKDEKNETHHAPSWPGHRRSRAHRPRSADPPSVHCSLSSGQLVTPKSTSNSEHPPSVELAIAKELEALDAAVSEEIEKVQREIPSPPSPPMESPKEPASNEVKTRTSRIKRKFQSKIVNAHKEGERKAIVSARKKFLQQRRNKTKMRRARELINCSINPSIFSQFCAAKGMPRVTERIQWKKPRKANEAKMMEQRTASPDIDTWSSLAARDATLENTLYYSQTLPATITDTPKPEEPPQKDVSTLSPVAKLEASIDPCLHSCCCRTHCSHTLMRLGLKKDAMTETDIRGIDISTQTPFFSNFEGVVDQKEGRSKSEGGSEKRTSGRHMTKRFFDFISEQTACVTGGRERVNHKQEAIEYRQFLLSRYLENSANQNAERPEMEAAVTEKAHEKQV